MQGIMAECAGLPSNGGKQSKDKQKNRPAEFVVQQGAFLYMPLRLFS